ncbi:hypothetical protein BJ741DRAFT_595580, partial [Chytriomyces cf. hyalinus JEL632]
LYPQSMSEPPVFHQHRLPHPVSSSVFVDDTPAVVRGPPILAPPSLNSGNTSCSTSPVMSIWEGSEYPRVSTTTRVSKTKANDTFKLGRHVCPWPGCNKSFSELFNLKSHYFLHSNIRPHKCTLCEMDFVRLRDMQRHARSVHNLSARKQEFMCDGCGGYFARKDSLQRHLKICDVKEEGFGV